MSEKEKKNDPLLEESSVLSNSPLQDIHQGKDKFGQTAQVPDEYIFIHVSVYICVYRIETPIKFLKICRQAQCMY